MVVAMNLHRGSCRLRSVLRVVGPYSGGQVPCSSCSSISKVVPILRPFLGVCVYRVCKKH